jgi:hypothetical protein
MKVVGREAEEAQPAFEVDLRSNDSQLGILLVDSRFLDHPSNSPPFWSRELL